MKAAQLLHKMLKKTCPDIHKTRLNALMAGVLSGANHHQISVTSLGRNLREYSATNTKHDIKRMDRLIINDKRYKIYIKDLKQVVKQLSQDVMCLGTIV